MRDWVWASLIISKITGGMMSLESNVNFLEKCEEKYYFDWKVDNMAPIMSLTPTQIVHLFVDDMFDCDGHWQPRNCKYYWEK